MLLKSIFTKPSTRAFFKEADKIPGYTLFDRIHGYIYGRWTFLYISLGTGRHPLSKKLAPLLVWWQKRTVHPTKEENPAEKITMADTYHGKAIPLETATQLVMVNESVNIPDLEQVIPYKRARALVLQNPDHIVALNCPCRVSKENPCLPLDVCLVVGEPFASFVMDHNPEKARWISQEDAVAILKAEDELGHVHHAFFKDAMLGRFYAICNCCSCCCGAMHAHQTGTPMLASSGYIATVDDSSCTACENCIEYCQFGALAIRDWVNTIDLEKCMGCGVCVSKCPQEAISLKLEPAKGSPMEIVRLLEQAAAQAIPAERVHQAHKD